MPSLAASPHRFVVLIEDDAAVRHGITAYLSTRGILVTAAPDADEAIKAVAAAALCPDLLIVNYRLAGETALDAAPRFLRTLSLPLPVLVITGDTSSQVRNAVAREGWRLLIKPFQPAELLRVISQLAPKP